MDTTIILILIVIVAGLVCITFRQLDKIEDLEDKLNESEPIFLPLDVRVRILEEIVDRLDSKKKQKK